MTRTFPTRIFVVALILTAVAGAAFAQTDLIISEYIEGSSSNKAIELYNPTANPINMTTVDYRLSLYSNGAAAPSQTLLLTATIPAGGTWVIAHPSANVAILAAANQTSGTVINFNGDDALVLTKAGLATVVERKRYRGHHRHLAGHTHGDEDRVRHARSRIDGDLHNRDLERRSCRADRQSW